MYVTILEKNRFSRFESHIIAYIGDLYRYFNHREFVYFLEYDKLFSYNEERSGCYPRQPIS